MVASSRVNRLIEESQDQAVDLLRRLVSVPTVSGDTARYEEAVTLAQSFIHPRLECTVVRSDGGPNLVAKLGEGSPVLLLTGHIDVVPAEARSWTVGTPFEPVLKDGRLYGRGACDMKAGLAAMLTAANVLARLPLTLSGTLLLALTVDEEVGGEKGLGYLVREGLRADQAILCEPTGLDLIVACKGPLWLKITTKGRACHAGLPWDGVNAIAKMVKILPLLDKWGLDVPAHPVVGRPTLSLGLIRGGERPNLVADHCEVTLDLRLVPGQTPQDAARFVQEAIAAARESDPEVEATVDILRHRSPLQVPEESDLVRALEAASERWLGRRPLRKGMPSPGDGSFLAGVGIPTVMFGPGREEECHVPDEWVEVDQLKAAITLYVAVALDTLGSSPRP